MEGREAIVRPYAVHQLAAIVVCHAPVRGFLSTAAKKHNLKIASVRNEAGERTHTVDR